MPKGRWQNFSIKSSEPRLWAIVKMPDGTLQKRLVKKDSSTLKKYEGYTKSLQGLYVPPSIARELYQPK